MAHEHTGSTAQHYQKRGMGEHYRTSKKSEIINCLELKNTLLQINSIQSKKVTKNCSNF